VNLACRLLLTPSADPERCSYIRTWFEPLDCASGELKSSPATDFASPDLVISAHPCEAADATRIAVQDQQCQRIRRIHGWDREIDQASTDISLRTYKIKESPERTTEYSRRGKGRVHSYLSLPTISAIAADCYSRPQSPHYWKPEVSKKCIVPT
jgi:hypothetical protein